MPFKIASYPRLPPIKLMEEDASTVTVQLSKSAISDSHCSATSAVLIVLSSYKYAEIVPLSLLYRSIYDSTSECACTIASAFVRISFAFSDRRPGLISMETLTVPVSSAVISSVCIPLARNRVAAIRTKEDSIIRTLCFSSPGMIRR